MLKDVFRYFDTLRATRTGRTVPHVHDQIDQSSRKDHQYGRRSYKPLHCFVTLHGLAYIQVLAGVSISTDGQQMHRLLCSYRSTTIFEKEEATSLKNVVNKKYIIKSE